MRAAAATGSGERKASSPAGFGLLMQYPWATSHPSSESRSKVASSSMPSATIRSPIAWPRSIVERTRSRSRSLSRPAETRR